MATFEIKANLAVLDAIQGEKKEEDKASTKDSSKETNENEPVQRLKSTGRIIAIGLIISISALINGYGIKEITSVPIGTLIDEYGITMDKSSAQSILIGILPIGAILGVFITKYMLIYTRRLTGIYIFALVNVGAIALVNVTTFGTLIAGRFIQGICIGFYTTVAPIYLKEIAPKQLRKLLGLFFSLGKIIGLIFQASNIVIGWRIILSLTAIFSVLQAFLMFFFGSDTPSQLIQKNLTEQAKKIIDIFYVPQCREAIYNEYKKEEPNGIVEVGSLAQINHRQHKGQAQNPEEISKPMKFQMKKKKAFWLAVHLCIIRHWTAGNTIITQGGLFIKGLHSELGKYSSLNINLVQFLFVIVGLIWVKNHFGKRSLFLFSIPVLSALNLALSLSMYFEEVFSAKVIMCLYMAIYGGAFISPIWSYPSEIVPASEAVIPNVAHWLALATSTLIPPIIAGAMPNGNPYPVFVFFGLYGFLSFIHVYKDAKESDGKAYNEIIQSFD